MRHGSTLFLLICMIAWIGCDRIRDDPARLIKLGGGYNMWNECVGHASHECGPEHEEISDMFTTAFAAEPACQGVRLQPLTAKEQHIPIKDIPGYLDLFFQSPSRWSYQFNFKGKFLKATVANEREIARDVCRIVKSSGGEI